DPALAAGASGSGDHRVMPKRKRSAPQQGGVPVAKQAGTGTLFPMRIQIGHRFTEGGYEWEVVTHPAAFQGGKSLRARIRRPGVPESETEMIWPAHVRVKVRRTQ